MSGRLEPVEWEHGTRTAYRKHGCRCVACRGWKVGQLRKERGPKAPVAVSEPVVVHGAWSAYSKGCRCVECCRWNGAKQRRLKDARRAAEVAVGRSFVASLTVEVLRRKVVA